MFTIHGWSKPSKIWVVDYCSDINIQLTTFEKENIIKLNSAHSIRKLDHTSFTQFYQKWLHLNPQVGNMCLGKSKLVQSEHSQLLNCQVLVKSWKFQVYQSLSSGNLLHFDMENHHGFQCEKSNLLLWAMASSSRSVNVYWMVS
jgi:hypothetical protein